MALYKTFSSMGKQDVDNKTIEEDVPRITSAQQRQSIINNNFLVVIDNYTDWCGPCKQCAPHFQALTKKYSQPGICALVKENADDKCGGQPVSISGVPCFHFYMNKIFLPKETITGANINDIENTIKRLLSMHSK